MLSRKRPSKLCLPGVKMSWPGSMRIILGLLFFSAQHYNSEGKGTEKMGDCENLRCWIFVVSS